MTVGEILGVVQRDSPVLVLLAVVLLAGAAAAYKRAAGSLQRIGGRVGELEQTVASEQTRRQQVEAVLIELGIPLPVWPADPVNLRELAVLRGRSRREESRREREDEREDLEDGAGDELLTREAPLPPVPAFTPDERAAFARHRR
jgi:hypothetical protein